MSEERMRSLFHRAIDASLSGLKEENAAMLSSIDEIDGGLIALTRFSGEIGFYPDEYLRIIDLYMNGKGEAR